jgi:hypothetical protein
MKDSIFNFNFLEAELNDQGIYELVCSKGHKSLTFVQEQHFEVLFDMGGLALIDGYNREAVSSFAASLERFYEFCIRVISYSEDIEDEEIEATWKHIKNQSERQIGAFYFLYLTKFKKPPKAISNYKINGVDLVGFRNKVIHKGYIPKQQDALQYGEHLYNYMVDILLELRLECEDEIFKMVTHKQRIFFKGKESIEVPLTSMASPSMFGISSASDKLGKSTFHEELKSLGDSVSYRFTK